MSIDLTKPHIEYGDDVFAPLDTSTLKKVREGWRLTKEIKALGDQLKKIKADLQNQEIGAVLVDPRDKVRVPISEVTTISIGDVEVLKDEVRGDIELYCEHSDVYKPTARYKDAIADKEHEEHDMLIDSAAIKESVAVKFFAVK